LRVFFFLGDPGMVVVFLGWFSSGFTPQFCMLRAGAVVSNPFW